METIEEWEFINSSLKDQIGNALNEWHIGLAIGIGSMADLWLLINGNLANHVKVTFMFLLQKSIPLVSLDPLTA